MGFVGLPLEAEGMVTETTGQARLMVALPEKHPMARKKDLRLEELSKEAYILWPRHLSPGSYDQLLSVFGGPVWGRQSQWFPQPEPFWA